MPSRNRSRGNRGCWSMFLAMLFPPLFGMLIIALLRRKQKQEAALKGAALHPMDTAQARLVVSERPAAEEITLPRTTPRAKPQGIKAQAASKTDDLTILEGIGIKVAALLNQAGIQSFGALAEAAPDRLRQILAEARLNFIDPETWPEQARLAAEGKMDELDELTKKLRGGRRTQG